jgi:hypothetical protein
MIEVLQRTFFRRKMTQAAIVKIQRQQRGGELCCQLTGERRLPGSGTASQSQDERTLWKQKLLGGMILQGSGSFLFWRSLLR